MKENLGDEKFVNYDEEQYTKASARYFSEVQDTEVSARYFAIAEQAQKDMDYEIAAIALEKYVKLRPLSAERHLLLCKAQIEAGMFRKAANSFKTVLRLNPHRTVFYNEIGEFLWSRGEFDMALNYFCEYVKKQPGNKDDYFRIGGNYLEVRNFKKAATFYTKAIEMGQEDVEVFYCRGFVYSMLGRDKLALADFEQALKIDPSFLQAYFEKGRWLCFLNEFEETFFEFYPIIVKH